MFEKRARAGRRRAEHKGSRKEKETLELKVKKKKEEKSRSKGRRRGGSRWGFEGVDQLYKRAEEGVVGGVKR